MPTRRFYANAAPQQTLANSITSGATTCQIAGSFAGWPTQFPFYAALDLGAAAFEIVSVTAIAGTTATIARAQDGTVAVAHPAGATLNQIVVRQDFDEANAHTSANSGVHGIAGNVVGTSDVQTLTNKTLTSPAVNSPTVTGGTASDLINTGDASHPALTGKATTAGGKTLSLQNSAAVEKLGVDDAGNLTTSGNVTASSGAVTGKTVAGALVPTTFTNEATASAALPAPATNTVVWLTAPTGGGPAGPYAWTGTAWAMVTPGFLYGEDAAHAGNSAALATVGTAVASPSSVTFTLPVQRRVRIETYATFNANTAPARYLIRAGYNSGSSVVIGSAQSVGLNASVVVNATGASGNAGGAQEGTALLAAGTYTAYAQLTRNAGGSATDIGFNCYIAVYDVGAV